MATRDPGPRPFRVATYLAPLVRPVYELAARRIGEALGVRSELVVGRDVTSLATGDEHLAFLCSPIALHLTGRAEPPVEIVAAPVLLGGADREPPTYRSEVVVRAGDPASGLGDLRDRTWAYNEEASHSGYGVVLASVAALGAGPEFFGGTVRTGAHTRSLRAVVDGVADWAAIDEQVFALQRRQDPGLDERVRVIDRLGPSPIQPAVVWTGLEGSVRRTVIATLLQLGEEPEDASVLSSCLVERFVEVTEADYEPIREMQRAASAAGLAAIPG